METAAGRLRRFEERLVPRVRAFAQTPEMLAVQWALPRSFAVLAAALAIAMLTRQGGFYARLYGSFALAFGAMSFGLLFLLVYDLARRRDLWPAAALVPAALAFFVSLPYERARTFEEVLRALGSSGLFLAIGVALASNGAIAFASGRLGRRGGWLAGGALVVGLACLMRLEGISPVGLLDAAVAPLGTLGDSLPALLLITFVETVLWTLGIHGPALLAAVVLPVYMNLQIQNSDAFARGAPLPHLVTVSTFLFVFPGGAGATLPLVVLLLRSKAKRARIAAMTALVPALFNANEPLMFGLPLVLNPYFAIPFVTAPLVLGAIAWEAMRLGLVGAPSLYIPSSIPSPIGVVLATRDWRALLLLALNLAVALAIYAPFVRLYERHERALERAA